MKESFKPEELFILLQSIDQQLLVGCPEIQDCQLTPIESSKKAEKLLREKGLLDTHSHLTKKGAEVIRFLELYCGKEKYIFVNNCFMTFYEDMGIGLIQGDTGYHFVQLMRQQFLEEVYLTNALLRNELEEEEQVSRKEVLGEQEKETILANAQGQLLSIGQLSRKDQKIVSQNEWLFFKKGDQLFELAVQTKKIYQTSQGLLNKRVVDTLEITYEKGRGWFE